MAQAPFPNDYQARLVAESSQRACTLCYKPCTSVLLASNSADFFYVCASHLHDVTFATPVHPETYTKLVQEQKVLEKQVEAAEAKAEASKPYSWNKLVSLWKKEEDKSVVAYESLVAEAKTLREQLTAQTEAIAAFKFVKYTLHKDIYKMRINNHLQAKLRLQQQKKIQEPSFFPSAPSTPL